MTRHCNQCICQICTCGHHRCPHDRNQSRISFNEYGLNSAEHYQRKEYATANSKNYERVRPIVRSSEKLLLNGDRPQSSGGKDSSANDDTFLGRSHKSEYNLEKSALEAKQRFVTSNALRERSRKSQIHLSQGDVPSELSTSYTELTKSIKQAPSIRVNSVRPPDSEMNDILSHSSDNNVATSTNCQEYTQKRSERVEAKRPPTSDFWATSDTMNSITVSKSEFSPKQADSTTPFRPKDSGVLDTSDKTFQRETSNLSDYGPKFSERILPIRPTDSNLLKNSHAKMESKTVNRSEYSNTKGERYDIRPHNSSDIWKRNGVIESITMNRSDYSNTKGDRYAIRRPEDSNLLKGNGPLSMESTNRTEFGIKKGERVVVKRPEPSDIWKKEGQMESTTVNRQEYKATKGDRFNIRKPDDANILKGDGTLVKESTSHAEFFAKKSERPEMKKPEASDVWKKNGTISSKSVNASDYSATKGERYETQRPKDSNILRGEGPFAAESTSTRRDYQTNPRGERYDVRKPQSSDLWKREGQIDSTTISRSEYSQKQGVTRHTISKPKDSKLFNTNENESMTTNHREEYVTKKGERFKSKPSQNQSNNLLNGDGTFSSEKTSLVDFPKKTVEKFEPARKPLDSDIWQNNKNKKVETTTVSKSDFSLKTMESPRSRQTRAALEKSQILPPADINEKFAAAGTSNSTHFSVKKGERFETKRPETSNIWKSDGKMEDKTVSSEEFTKKETGQRSLYIPTDTLTIEHSKISDQSDFVSVSHEDFSNFTNGFNHDRLSRNNTQNHSELNMILNANQSEQFPSRSITHDDFGLKNLSNRPSPMPPPAQLKIDPNATFENKTAYTESFHTLPNDVTARTNASKRGVRPSTALKLTGEINLTTGYKEEFGKKRPDNAHVSCVAGQLVDSVKKNHKETDKFEFKQVDNGHHYYQLKR